MAWDQSQLTLRFLTGPAAVPDRRPLPCPGAVHDGPAAAAGRHGSHADGVFCTLSLFKTQISTWGKSKGEGGGSLGRGKGEGPWEKVQVLWICRGVGVVTSRVTRDEYRTWGLQNDRLVFSNKPD